MILNRGNYRTHVSRVRETSQENISDVILQLAVTILSKYAYDILDANVNCIVKKDRRCTYNVILESVRITIVTVEGSKYYLFRVCVCSLSYPACRACAP